MPDAIGGYAGPLAGLHAGPVGRRRRRSPSRCPATRRSCRSTSWRGCAAGLESAGADLAVARTFDQPHPVFALVRTAVRAHLEAFLAGGGRKIDAWYATLAVVEVAFDDEAAAFSNINTRDELEAADGAS